MDASFAHVKRNSLRGALTMTSRGRWRRRATIATSGVAAGLSSDLGPAKERFAYKSCPSGAALQVSALLICSRIERAGHSIVVWQLSIVSK